MLAMHCDYFDALLFGDVGKRPSDEVSLEDVDPDDFATFLRALSCPLEAVRGTVILLQLRQTNVASICENIWRMIFRRQRGCSHAVGDLFRSEGNLGRV